MLCARHVSGISSGTLKIERLFTVVGAIQPKFLNGIAKGHLCLREENLSFITIRNRVRSYNPSFAFGLT